MTPEEWKGNLVLIASQARIISMVDIPKMLEQIDRAEAIGPLLDPTLYRANAGKMDEDKELLEAALPLWRFFAKIKARAEGGNG